MASYSVFKAKFKKTIADAIYQEVTSRTARYYHWFGKENSWQDFLSPFIPANPTADEPGAPSDNFRYDLHVRRDILTAKLVKPSDVSYVVRRIDWVSNTVYDDYDDAYDTTTGFGFGPAYSGATRLEDSNFYVLTSQYNVYKCIWNNYNSPSTVQPTGTTPDVFETSDGYKWKFMYTLPVSLRNRFLSGEYMPVSNALKAQFYSSGEVNNISIEDGGGGYNPATTTAVITGDGYLQDNPYIIENIQITNGGVSYTSIPNVIISEPFSEYFVFTADLNVKVGTYIKHTDPSTLEDKYYYVVSGTQLGTTGPTHTTGTVTNGSTQLKFVGKRARVSVNISGGAISSATLDEAGYGYENQPTAIVDDPVTKDNDWEIALSVSLNDIIYYNGNYYTVTTAGTCGTSGPTHITGTETNGTAELQFTAKDAELLPVTEKTNALINLIISPGIDSVFRVIVSNPVPKYTEAPNVTIAAPTSGVQAEGTVSILNGRVSLINLTNPGSGYTSAPAVTIGKPVKTFNAQDDISVSTISYDNHLLTTGDEVIYNNGGGTDVTGLTNNNTYYAIVVDENTFKLATTFANAQAGTAVGISPGSDEEHTLTLTAGATGVATLGTGGEVVGYEIVDGGYGYTNANIEIVDSSQSDEWNRKNEGGAVLVANFNQGNVDTLQANVELLAVPGAIYTVKVVDGGQGYSAATVEVIGDGEGAEAIAVVNDGQVSHIEITNPGRGYTWTDVIITGNTGASGAVARAIMTPLGGHGSNAIDELNANAIVFYTSISRDKNQGLEITNDYRKVGLVRNFKEFGSNRRFTEDVGSGCVLITGQFNPAFLEYDMLLTKDEYKKYRIVEFTDTQILLSVFNNFTIDVGDVLTTDPTNAGRVSQPTVPVSNITVESVTERTIDPFSGDFLFFSVRESYAPTSDQIITVRTIVEI